MFQSYSEKQEFRPEKGNNIEFHQIASSLPDIYFIILDGYGRNDILHEVFEYDNSKFTEFLEDSGFFVAKKSNSNYASTIFSITSTLNMEYLDHLSSNPGRESIYPSLYYEMIKYNKVANVLRKHDYLIINTNSLWSPTGEWFESDMQFGGDSIIDIHGNKIKLTEYNMVFLQTTILSPFIKIPLVNKVRDHTLHTFDNLVEISKLDERKFVLAHINSPHPPYVFGENGEEVSNPDLEITGWQDEQGYIAQLKFITKKTQETINKIIDNSINEPIIVIQSDHGPPMSIQRELQRGHETLDEAGIKERMAILNAYYFPDRNYISLYDDITPVNSFRLIFRQYLDIETELLDDNSYFSSDHERTDDFQNVSEILK